MRLGGTEGLLDSAELIALEEAFRRDPQNQDAREQIRRVDRQLREEYFRRRDFSQRGVLLLAGGVMVLLASLHVAGALRKTTPALSPADPTGEEFRRAGRLGRWSVVVVGVLGGGSALAWALLAGPRASLDVAARPAPDAPVSVTAGQIAGNWPRFRGPGGAGVSAHENVPTHWDGRTGKGVLWKSAVPLPGNNSPIVWGNRIFLTGANDKRREVYCFSADTGKLLWRKGPVVVGTRVGVPEVQEDTGFAAPTCVTDGQRVFAMFANGDVGAFDFEGKQIWAQNLGLPENIYGHASSLEIASGALIVLFDQGMEEESKSRLLALDLASGEEIWSTSRDVPNSWASPVRITAAGREQVITSGDPWVIAYDPIDGSEIWRVKCLHGDIGPSPVLAGELVLASNVRAALAAIRPDGQGDVTQTHVAWTADEGLPELCSPVSSGELVWLLTMSGELTCYDVGSGKKLYEEFLERVFIASPGLAGDRLYLLSEDGEMCILQAGREYKLLGTAHLGEKAFASPAFTDGRVYIRGEKNLYAIGK